MPRLSPAPFGLIALKAGSYEWSRKTQWQDLTQQVGPYVNILGWFTPDTLFYAQQIGGVNSLYTRHNDTGEVTAWPNTVDPTVGFAGGGVWAATCAGQYQDSWGRNPRFPDQPTWVPYSVDSDTGAVAVRLNDWLYVYQGNTDPKRATLTPLLQIDLWQGVSACFTNGTLVICRPSSGASQWYHWRAGGDVIYIGFLTRPQMDPVAQWMDDVNAGYSPWYGQVVWEDWQPYQAISLGWITNYNPQVYRETPTSPIITVVGSRGEGELPGEQQVYTIDLLNHTLDGVPWSLVNVTTPPVAPYRPPTFTQKTRPLAILCLDEPTAKDPTTPQIWSIDFPKPKVIIGVDCTLSTYPPAKMSQAYAAADAARLFVYPGWDAVGQYNPAKLPPEANPSNTIPMVLAYLIQGHPVSEAVAAWKRDIARIRAAGYTGNLALEVQAFRGSLGNGQYRFSEQDLSDCWTAVDQLVIEERIRVLVLFTWDRADGLISSACAQIRESLPTWRLTAPNWKDCPTRQMEDDEMLTLFKSCLERFWENPNEWVLKGPDGRFLQINFEWQIIWRRGVNQSGPDHIESDSAFEWTEGSTVAYAVRNGTRREFKVDLSK